MDLKKATLLALIGISYIFVIKTLGTFLPDIFKNLFLAQVTGIITLLAISAILLFFVSFRYAQDEQTFLKKTSLLVIIGYFARLLVKMGGLLYIFNIYLPYKLLSSIEPIVLCLSSGFVLLFFIAFYQKLSHEKQMRLKRATLLAIIGTSALTLLRTGVILGLQYRLSILLSGKLMTVVMLVLTFGFITNFYFFLSFYKDQIRE